MMRVGSSCRPIRSPSRSSITRSACRCSDELPAGCTCPASRSSTASAEKAYVRSAALWFPAAASACQCRPEVLSRACPLAPCGAEPHPTFKPSQDAADECVARSIASSRVRPASTVGRIPVAGVDHPAMDGFVQDGSAFGQPDPPGVIGDSSQRAGEDATARPRRRCPGHGRRARAGTTAVAGLSRRRRRGRVWSRCRCSRRGNESPPGTVGRR